MIDCVSSSEIWTDLKILSKRFKDPQFEPRAESFCNDPSEDPDIPYLQAVRQYAQSLILGCSASRDNLIRLARHAEPPGWETYKIRYALPENLPEAGVLVTMHRIKPSKVTNRVSQGYLKKKE